MISHLRERQVEAKQNKTNVTGGFSELLELGFSELLEQPDNCEAIDSRLPYDVLKGSFTGKGCNKMYFILYQ